MQCLESKIEGQGRSRQRAKAQIKAQVDRHVEELLLVDAYAPAGPGDRPSAALCVVQGAGHGIVLPGRYICIPVLNESNGFNANI